MDGGALAINNEGIPQTIWRRKGILYACEPGKAEREIGEGKSCTLTTSNGRNIYTWVDKGQIICQLPNGEKRSLGEGNLPSIKALNKDEVICVWELDKMVKYSILKL